METSASKPSDPPAYLHGLSNAEEAALTLLEGAKLPDSIKENFKFSSILISIDFICDWIPVISIITNLIKLILKGIINLFLSDSYIKNSIFFSYIKEQSIALNYWNLFPMSIFVTMQIYIRALHNYKMKYRTLLIKKELETWNGGFNSELVKKRILEASNSEYCCYLDLSNLGLTSLPKNLAWLTSDITLDCSNNLLRTLPKLPNVTRIYYYDNRFETSPDVSNFAPGCRIIPDPDRKLTRRNSV